MRPNFAHYFSLDDAKSLNMAFQAKDVQSLPPGQNPFDKAVETLLTPAISEYLDDMRSGGLLTPIAYAAGRKTPFVLAWTRYINGEYLDNWDRRDVARFFKRHLLAAACFSRDCDDKAGEEVHDKIVATMNAGNFRFFLTSSQECAVTGDKLYVDARNWTFMLGTAGQDGLIPAEPLPHVPDLQHIEIEFARGDLIVADWFQFSQFQAITEPLELKHDLGTELGRSTRAEAFANELGMICIHGGGIPSLFSLADGTVIFGHDDVDERPAEGCENLGKVWTYFRNVVVIERNRLIEIVAEGGDQDAADAKVGEYLRSHKMDIVRLSVDPGTYHFYFSPKSINIDDQLQVTEFSLKDHLIDQVSIVMSPAPLTFKDECSAGKAPGL